MKQSAQWGVTFLLKSITSHPELFFWPLHRSEPPPLQTAADLVFHNFVALVQEGMMVCSSWNFLLRATLVSCLVFSVSFSMPCRTLCQFKYVGLSEKVMACERVFCKHEKISHDGARKETMRTGAEAHESGRWDLSAEVEKKSSTCVGMCKSRYASTEEQMACVVSGCRQLYRYRMSRIRREVEVAETTLEGNPDHQKKFCFETCLILLPNFGNQLRCVSHVCLTGDDVEAHGFVSEVREGKRSASACKAFCQVKHAAPEKRLFCMEIKCTGMYRDRIGRIKRAAPALSSSCMAMCAKNFESMEEKLGCIRTYNCRGMYRDRVGRFAKKNDYSLAKSFPLQSQNQAAVFAEPLALVPNRK